MNIFVEVVLTGLYIFVALVLTVLAIVCVLGAIASADMRNKQRKSQSMAAILQSLDMNQESWWLQNGDVAVPQLSESEDHQKWNKLSPQEAFERAFQDYLDV